jgi:hypothetical protein
VIAEETGKNVAISEGKEVEVKVQAKQVKNLVVIRVTNNGVSKLDLCGFEVSVPDSKVIAFRGPDECNRGSILKIAMSSAYSKPMYGHDKAYFFLKIEDVKPLIEWMIYDPSENRLAEGSVVPFIL